MKGSTEMENPARAELSRYDITIAGRRFNISSRHGEAHIRKVERLVRQTIEEMGARTQGQSPLNAYLLAALNLGDRLVELESRSDEADQEREQRLQALLGRLRSAVAPGHGSGAGNAPAEQS
ncbi:MAG: cell division protein ZapA [Candidatus Lambdaproteobacteria bacterium]|nr:cell division protein ZapA [Candidatus Lambdaproteobacteria bacterium]